MSSTLGTWMLGRFFGLRCFCFRSVSFSPSFFSLFPHSALSVIFPICSPLRPGARNNFRGPQTPLQIFPPSLVCFVGGNRWDHNHCRCLLNPSPLYCGTDPFALGEMVLLPPPALAFSFLGSLQQRWGSLPLLLAPAGHSMLGQTLQRGIQASILPAQYSGQVCVVVFFCRRFPLWGASRFVYFRVSDRWHFDLGIVAMVFSPLRTLTLKWSKSQVEHWTVNAQFCHLIDVVICDKYHPLKLCSTESENCFLPLCY